MDSDDSDDRSDDRSDDLEQELVELKLRRHKASLLPDPGIKGWLKLYAVWLVILLLVQGALLIEMAGPLEPLLSFLLLIVFCYLLYVTVIFFQCKKSTRTHMKVILLLVGIVCGVEFFKLPDYRLERDYFLFLLLFHSFSLGYWHFSDRVAVTFGSSHIA